MRFFWEHKFLSLLIIGGIVFWTNNHKEQFGWSRPGIVIHSRVPVAFFDLYVDNKGERFIFEDLLVAMNRKDWMDKNIISLPDDNSRATQLLIGTGFAPQGTLELSDADQVILANKGFEIRIMDSRRAMDQYNSLVTQKRPVAILLHLLR